MARRILTAPWSLIVILLQVLALASAAKPEFCKNDKQVSTCVKSVNKHITRTHIVKKFCSAVLKCPRVTTTTLRGTVTKTKTKWVQGEDVPWEEISYVTTTTSTFDYTETTDVPVTTTTLRPTWTVEKFVVTTPNPNAKRGAKEDERMLQRAKLLCPKSVQSKACDCLYNCPPMITRDRRKTIRVVETGTSADYTTIYIPDTLTDYEPIYYTATEFYTETSIAAVFTTHATTVTCSRSPSNTAFYLSATISPAPAASLAPYNGKYVQARPEFQFFRDEGALFWPRNEVTTKTDASVFTIDAQGRLVTQTSYGPHYAVVDPYGSFQLFHLLTEQWLVGREWYFVNCNLAPASGRYPGGFRELNCTAGYFNVDTFQWCPIYQEWFGTGTVLGESLSSTSPDCFAITYLAVPVCA